MQHMSEHEKVESRFSYAESLWCASMYLTLRRDHRYLRSTAIVRTAAGMVCKRDVAAVDVRNAGMEPAAPQPTLRRRKTPARRRLEPSLALIVVSILFGLGVLLHVYMKL